MRWIEMNEMKPIYRRNPTRFWRGRLQHRLMQVPMYQPNPAVSYLWDTQRYAGSVAPSVDATPDAAPDASWPLGLNLEYSSLCFDPQSFEGLHFKPNLLYKNISLLLFSNKVFLSFVFENIFLFFQNLFSSGNLYFSCITTYPVKWERISYICPMAWDLQSCSDLGHMLWLLL